MLINSFINNCQRFNIRFGIKRSTFFVLICLSSAIPALALPTDSIKTYYKDGVFTTYCQVWVRASDSITNSVANDFVYQARYNLDTLFTWALKGLNLRKEQNDIMIFNFKSTHYDKESNTIRGVGDVIIPKVTTIPNIMVDSKMTQKRYANGKTVVDIDLLYSNGFLKKMRGSFSAAPSVGQGNWYIMETHVKFGWFFNIFITQHRFKEIMEWRLKRFVHNIRDEAEKREKTHARNKR